MVHILLFIGGYDTSSITLSNIAFSTRENSDRIGPKGERNKTRLG
jgi:hypothetical protein